MSYRIEFSPDAQEDILAAARYIRDVGRSPQNAAGWYEGIYKAIMGLADLPRAHPLAREDAAFEEEVRQLVYKSHRVIYTVGEGVVVIHRVWHVAREDAEAGELPGLE